MVSPRGFCVQALVRRRTIPGRTAPTVVSITLLGDNSILSAGAWDSRAPSTRCDIVRARLVNIEEARFLIVWDIGDLS